MAPTSMMQELVSLRVQR